MSQYSYTTLKSAWLINIITVPALSPFLPCTTDLQLVVVHAVCVAGVELWVVGHVQQLNDQVTGQELSHKRMLEEQITHQYLEQ